jgi:diguanylate cyclase
MHFQAGQRLPSRRIQLAGPARGQAPVTSAQATGVANRLLAFFEHYRSKYVGSRLLEEYRTYASGGGLSLDDLAECIEHVLAGNESTACRELVVKLFKANVPFMIVAHEIAFLRDTLIKLAIEQGDIECVSETIVFFDKLEDQLAAVYLSHYLHSLATRNHVRMRHISALSEKNILVHFEDHLNWMHRLTQAVMARDATQLPEVSSGHCAFGHWLHNEGITLIRDQSHYKQIDHIHSVMHRVVEEIQDTLKLAESQHLRLYALMKKAENYSLDLGNEISMLNSMVIMSVYNKDPLTGLLTRRNLDRILINQLEISRATETPFCLVMCDLDHFKDINDQFGHSVGDQAITHFTRLARHVIRQADLMFRYGGDEFLIILPSTDYDQGMRIAAKLGLELNEQALPLENGDSLTVHASFGLLEVVGGKVAFIDTELGHELLRECDRKLYLAKQRGRNQVA